MNRIHIFIEQEGEEQIKSINKIKEIAELLLYK